MRNTWSHQCSPISLVDKTEIYVEIYLPNLGWSSWRKRDLKYSPNDKQIKLDIIWVKSLNVSLAQYLEIRLIDTL